MSVLDSAPEPDKYPGRWEVISSLCGVIYFLAWSASFYPQLILNYRRKSAAGLSADFTIINPLSFLALTLWSWSMYFSPIARHQYRLRNGGHDPQISFADLGFSLHALLVSLFQLGQVWWYSTSWGYTRWYARSRGSKPGQGQDGTSSVAGLNIQSQRNTGTDSETSPLLSSHSRPSNRAANLPDGDGDVVGASSGINTIPTSASPLIPSRLFLILISLILLLSTASGLAVALDKLQFLDWLYLLSGIKLAISAIKFVPQVLLNWKLRSSEGFAVSMPIMDLVGGIFSFLQLFIDSVFIDHHPAGIVANPVKLGLSLLSLLFDTTFILQKFWFFPKNKAAGISSEVV